MAKRKTIRLVGDVQAEAVAQVLRRIPSVTDRYDVEYEHSKTAEPNALATNGKRITFPLLRLELLWPLTCANERNAPEPGLPHGRFPYGDKFVSACLAKNVSAHQILGLCTSGKWGANWPDLDETFRIESRRLTAGDARCDVKIGSFVLKRFRSERLFWTVDHPTDALLMELTKRLLSAAGLIETPSAVENAFAPAGANGLLGVYAVPVHPHVAAHFALAWYRPDQSYQAFDRSYTYQKYYEALVASAG